MTARTIAVRVGEAELLVETAQVSGTEELSRIGDATQRVQDAFNRAQTAIVEVATSTARMIEETGRRAARPDALEVEFGLRFSAEGSLIVAGSTSEATLRVKLTYNRTPTPSSSQGACSEPTASAAA